MIAFQLTREYFLLSIFLFIVVKSQNYSAPVNSNTRNFKVPLQTLCSWKTITYAGFVYDNSSDPCNFHGVQGNYLVERNIPTGFAKYDDRVFVSVQRQYGVYSTLNWFNVSDIQDGVCPELVPYPSYPVNKLSDHTCDNVENKLINVNKISIDSCGCNRKLWLVDTGSVSLGTVLSPDYIMDPKLCIISLNTNEILLCRIIDPHLYYKQTVLGLIDVEVHVVSDDCTETYGYILDRLNGFITVYSLKEDLFWQFNSNFFKLSPISSVFSVTTPSGKDITYMPHGGIWSATTDEHVLIFGPRASKYVFTMPLSVLHNETASQLCSDPNLGIKVLGKYNAKGQTAGLVYTHGVVFGIQEQNYAITCWNSKHGPRPNSVQFVAGGKEQVPFLMDLQLDRSDYTTLYAMSNNLIGAVLDEFDANFSNFKIVSLNIQEALKTYPECTFCGADYYSKDYSDYYRNYYSNYHGYSGY